MNSLGGFADFGEGFLQANDDRSSSEIDITSIFGTRGLHLNGQNYTSFYANNNGNISFGGPLSAPDAVRMGPSVSPIVIAPFWMDLDGTGGRFQSPGGVSAGTGFVWWDLDAASRTLTVTWDDISYTSAHNRNPAAFQLQIVGAGEGDFDIVFRYEHIANAAPDQPNVARVGFSLGLTGWYEVAGSGDAAAMAQMDTAPGNTREAGLWSWQVRGGLLVSRSEPGDPEPGDPEPGDPEPGDPEPGDPEPGDPEPGDPEPGDPDPVDPGPTEAPPDEPASVSLSLSLQPSQNEGQSGPSPYEVTIHREGDLTRASVVAWEIIIDDPNDLATGQPLVGTVVFGVGEQAVGLLIAIQGDRVFEADDSFIVRLTSVIHGRSTLDLNVSSTAAIINDDSAPITFALEAPSGRPEGSGGVTPFEFQATRSGDLTLGSTAHWRLDFQQTDGLDFAPGQVLEGDISFAPGVSSAQIVIQVAGDRRVELDEMFQVKLTSATYGVHSVTPFASTTGLIRNDDVPTNFAFAGPHGRPEGSMGETPFEFVVVRSGDLSQSSTVHWRIDLGHADERDFAPGQPLEGDVNFAPGVATARIVIQIAGDSRIEPDEAFELQLTSATTGSETAALTHATTGTIIDDDVRTSLLVASPSAIVQTEGAGATAFRFSVIRTGDVNQSVNTTYTISAPASGGLSVEEIQTPLTGLVSFAAGSAESALTVVINGDSNPEDSEVFTVTIGGSGFNDLILNGVVMNDDSGVGTSVRSGAPLSLGGLDGEPADFLQLLVGGSLWSSSVV